MMKIAAVVAIVMVACGRPATVVTVKLVDPRRVQSPDTTDRVYLVEVRSAPLSLLDRIRAGRGAEHPDTIPGIRVLFLPVVVEDSVVVGFWAMGAGGAPAGTFTYDLETKKVSRSPLPVWIHDLAEFSHPALSPDTRHLAYVAITPEGDQQGIIRHWPDGNVAQRGPSGRRQAYRHPGRAYWADNYRFSIGYDATVGPYPVYFVMKGDLRNWQVLEVDTLPWYGPLGEMVQSVGDSVLPAAAPFEGLQWNRPLRRLEPSAFKHLPEPFVRELGLLGCTIPQSEYQTAPSNVISGNFAAPGQTDWAVLCSRRERSYILVSWGGPARCPRELSPSDDEDHMPEAGTVRRAFSRHITASRSYHVFPAEGDTIQERDVVLDHDGIAETTQHHVRQNKLQSVWYCEAGTWKEFN